MEDWFARRCPHNFLHSNIIYFTDGLLDELNIGIVLDSTFVKNFLLSPDPGCILSALCHNFENIFVITSGLLLKQSRSKFSSRVNCSTMRMTAIQYSKVRLLKLCSEIYTHFETSPKISAEEWLQVAAKRGNYMIFLYARSQLTDELRDPLNLLELCIAGSLTESDNVVSEKLEIVRDIFSDYAENFIENDIKSSFSTKVHFKLAEYLIILGASPHLFGDRNLYIAHMAALEYTESQFSRICHLLIRKGFQYMLRVKYFGRNTAIGVALANKKICHKTFKIMPSLLEILDVEHLFSAITGFQETDALNLILKELPSNTIEIQSNICHHAAKVGNSEAICWLKSLGLNINNRDEFGNTPLHEAVKNGRKNIHKVVQTLIDLDVVIDALDSEGKTALWYTENGTDTWKLETRTVELLKAKSKKNEGNVLAIDDSGDHNHLLSFCAKAGIPADLDSKVLDDINATDELGRTALHWACMHENIQAIEYFLNMRVNPNALDEINNGNPPINYLSIECQTKLKILDMLLKFGYNINQTDKEGCNFLLYSVQNGMHVSDLENLISRGANWRVKLDNGNSVLHLAVKTGNVEALQHFFDLGSNVRDKNHNGCEPVHFLAFADTNFQETLQVLISNGGEINSVNKNGATLLLQSIIANRSLGDIKCLINRGGNCTATTNLGNGVLHYSVRNGSLEVVRYLLDLGSNINDQNSMCQKPIHFVALAKRNFMETLQVLMEHGADVNEVDQNGFTLALQCALVGRSVEELRYVTSCGANWRAKTSTGDNVIHLATQNGNFEALKYFLDLGLDINETNSCGRKPLQNLSLVENNFQETLQVLNTNGASINEFDLNGYNLLLQCALADRSVEELRYIIKLGGDWQVKSSNGDGILHLVTRNGNFEAVKYFLELGSDLRETNAIGLKPMHYVAQVKRNFRETLQVLVGFGADINAIGLNNFNLVLQCAFAGRRMEELRYVIELGGDWQAKTSSGNGALHLAARNGNFEVVKYLLDLGADIHEKDANGLEAIHFLSVANENFKETLEILTEKGSSINAVDNRGGNLLFHCALEGRSKLEMELLIQKGGNWKGRDYLGRDILSMAAEGGNINALQLFISLGANMNSKNEHEEMPLHYLAYAQTNLKECILLMIQNGANINAIDSNGDNLIMNAVVVGRSLDVIECIISCGCDWKIKNNDGQSVLHYAVKGGNYLALDYFLKKGLKVNCRDRLGRTPLLMFEFTNENKESTLKVLFEHKADINAYDDQENTLLEILMNKSKIESWNILSKVLHSI